MNEYIVKLDGPYLISNYFEEVLSSRRSVREYSREPIKLDILGRLLWAGQGITDSVKGLRTAPSAGALYPLELYIVANNVEGLVPGIYKYLPTSHEVVLISVGSVGLELYNASLEQSMVKDAAAVIVVCAVYNKMYIKYGSRSGRYLYFEAGCAAENISLQAVSLGLGTVVIGAFDDEKVKKLLVLPETEFPLCLTLVGKGKEEAI